jgi:hypothetical protein
VKRLRGPKLPQTRPRSALREPAAAPPLPGTDEILSTTNRYGAMRASSCTCEWMGSPPVIQRQVSVWRLAGAVKHCVKLRTSRAYREACGSVLVAGHTPLSELAALGGGIRARVLFVMRGGPTPACTAAMEALQVVGVSADVMKKLAGVESASGTSWKVWNGRRCSMTRCSAILPCCLRMGKCMANVLVEQRFESYWQAISSNVPCKKAMLHRCSCCDSVMC